MPHARTHTRASAPIAYSLYLPTWLAGRSLAPAFDVRGPPPAGPRSPAAPGGPPLPSPSPSHFLLPYPLPLALMPPLAPPGSYPAPLPLLASPFLHPLTPPILPLPRTPSPLLPHLILTRFLCQQKHGFAALLPREDVASLLVLCRRNDSLLHLSAGKKAGVAFVISRKVMLRNAVIRSNGDHKTWQTFKFSFWKSTFRIALEKETEADRNVTQ